MNIVNITNIKLKGNGLDLLKSIDKNCIKVCFFDPQYRGVLDKLNYGNEGKKRGKERADLPQMSEDDIMLFIKEIDRVLLNNGYLFLWVDKFHLLEGVKQWLTSNLFVVDMITWNKQKIGMGYRTRRKSEYLIVIQKKPKTAKNSWLLHNIPDVWDEKIINKNHTHTKPIELQKQLLLATTTEEDFILDPSAGSFSVLNACNQVNRKFIGIDLVFGE